MDALQMMKEDKVIMGEGFHSLLALLDTDMDRAGQKYEEIRLKLTGFFQGRGCADAEELADITFDRVAKRTAQGEHIRASDPYYYFRGVANNVFREYLRKVKPVPFEILPEGKMSGVDPREVEKENEYLKGQERKGSCMKQCFEQLGAEKRGLIVEFEKGEKSERIDNRKEMAMRLKTNLNALRIRIFKIRKELRACRDACLNSPAGEKIS